MIPDDGRFDPGSRPRYTPWLTFGRYRGEPVTQVPKSYLCWVMAKVHTGALELERDAREAIEHHLELPHMAVEDVPPKKRRAAKSQKDRPNFTHYGPDGKLWGPDAYWRCQDCGRTHKPMAFIPGAPGCPDCRKEEKPLEIPPTVPAGPPATTRGTMIGEPTMKVGDVFRSNYLRAADVDEPKLLTIKGAEIEEVGRGKDAEDKLVVRFLEDDRGLVCNVTNARAIEKIASSDDTDDWKGRKVVLWNDPAASYGGSTGGIRVRAPKTPKYRAPEPETLEEEGAEAF